MSIDTRRRAMLATAGLIVLLALSGCGRLQVESNPDTFPVPDDAASEVQGSGQSVALENFYRGATVVPVSEVGPGVDADLHQYTQTAITLLQRALEKRGFDVGPGEGKSVTLQVSNVTYNYGWTITYGLTLLAELKNGEKVVVTAQNSSPATAYRAIDGAIMRAVTKLFFDPEFQKYVTE